MVILAPGFHIESDETPVATESSLPFVIHFYIPSQVLLLRTLPNMLLENKCLPQILFPREANLTDWSQKEMVYRSWLNNIVLELVTGAIW